MEQIGCSTRRKKDETMLKFLLMMMTLCGAGVTLFLLCGVLTPDHSAGMTLSLLFFTFIAGLFTYFVGCLAGSAGND